ncbi:MAG: replicative DNA helicase [Phycisphaeraceae bacterium]|nr:MAG: replicative DNA helicase [Phycisphaeraceae bacterium]
MAEQTDRNNQGRDGRDGRRYRPAPIEVQKLFDRLPPHSPEAEMALLGSMILEPKVIGEVLLQVSSHDDFYTEAHGAIFRVIVDVYDRHQSGDLVQIVETLRGANALDSVGGPEYLLRLAETVPSAVNATHYARIVSDRARLRKLIGAAGQIIYDAYHAGDMGPDGTREVLDKAEMAIFNIAEKSETSDPQKLADILEQELHRLELLDGKGISGLATGYHDLDAMLSGLQPGEMVIVAARPSMGKTALALNLAEQIALGGASGAESRGTSKVPVAFFSLEMSRAAIAQRLLSARSGVDSHKMRRGQFSENDFKRLFHAAGELGDAPIYIDDTPNLTVLAMRARARRMAAMHGIRCIMIDYLQLMTAPGAARESRQVEVSTISRGIKALARELSVPVICLAQLNRGTELRDGNRPRMSDLRESGSIEQDADVVALLHREEYYHTQDADWADANRDKVGLAELIIAKQRNGPTGIVKLAWDPSTTRFKNYAGGFEDRYNPHEREVVVRATSPAQRPARTEPQPPHDGAGGDGAASPQRSGFAPGKKQGPLAANDPRWRDGGGPDDEAPFDDVDTSDIPI